MASTKELVYRLWRKLEGGYIPDDSKFTYRELKGYIRSGIGLALKQNYYESLNADEYRYGADTISATSTITVQTDAVTGLKFITLPASTINVAGNRQNIVTSKNPVARYTTSYVPVRAEEVFVARMQPSIPCVVLYYKEGSKLFFYNGEVTDKEVKLTQRYALPDDDDADLGLDDYENQILAQAMQLIINPQIPSDRANDGVPNI
jgi:hypothetical protein